jgi:hypothetical protein
VRIALRAWHLLLILVGICLATFGWLEWRRRQQDVSNASLLARLPTDNAIQFVINVQTLRQVGLLELLAGSQAAEEMEYQKFVQATGFDYREDLDAVIAALVKKHKFFLLRGRFQWPLIRNYMIAQGGNCRNGFCSSLQDGSGLYVSVFPILPGVLSLAVSDNPYAAYALVTRSEPSPDVKAPNEPFWLSLPVSVLNDGATLPSGTRAFASAAKSAEKLTFTLGAAGNSFQANMEVLCRTQQDAESMAAQLRQVTETLRRYIERERQQPNPKDLSGVLTAGTFQSQERRVTGRWPIERAFLESLAAGSY